MFLQRFLNDDSKEDEENKVIWDRLCFKQVPQVVEFVDMQPFLSGTIDDFMSMIAIVQLNIRKLVTNVFSWNIYDDSYQVTKNVATCQCLVGSFINHSCDPNVEWDFKNGCIVYLTTRYVI